MTKKHKLAKCVTANLFIEDSQGNCGRYHCPMAVLRSFLSKLATTEGYGIKQDDDVSKLSDEMIVKTLLQTGKLSFKVNKQEKKLESMDIFE